MSFFGRLMAGVAPEMALRRATAALKLDLIARERAQMSSGYEPVGGGRRGSEFRRNSQDATAVARGARGPLAQIARDMLRNNPRVVRANNLISAYTVGGGVVPVVSFRAGVTDKIQSTVRGLIADHLLTSAIDADGMCDLYSMQALAMQAIPISGEVLLRRRLRQDADGLPLPFQVQILETDYIASTHHGLYAGSGPETQEGIEYGPTGRAQAYHLYDRHPGGLLGAAIVRRVSAENVAHSYLLQRPGQRRGVSWYAPVMTELHDLHKLMSATLKRQEVAAMFAGILRGADAGKTEMAAVESGTIVEIGAEEDLTFNSPPNVGGADEVMRLLDRVIAAALGLTYEGFTGDYSHVNYSSGRMGRMDQDPQVRRWQQSLVINGQMSKVGGWFKEAVAIKAFIDPDDYTLTWTPPQRPVVDPTKDWPALIKKVGGGLTSRRQIIRESGEDPARVEAEIVAEREWERENRIIFETRVKADQEISDKGAQADE